jgi:uncharacterized protein YgiM (DUF1202 family)
MKPLNKKLLMYGGGAFVVGIALYLLFKKKTIKATTQEPQKKVDENIKDENTLPPIVYTKSGTRVRKAPSTSSAIINTYEKGQSLIPIDYMQMLDGVWYKVEQGWVRSDVVTENK